MRVVGVVPEERVPEKVASHSRTSAAEAPSSGCSTGTSLNEAWAASFMRISALMPAPSETSFGLSAPVRNARTGASGWQAPTSPGRDDERPQRARGCARSTTSACPVRTGSLMAARWRPKPLTHGSTRIVQSVCIRRAPGRCPPAAYHMEGLGAGGAPMAVSPESTTSPLPPEAPRWARAAGRPSGCRME